jgi:hypothetical protein
MKKAKRKSLAEGSKPDVSEEVKSLYKGLRDFKEGSSYDDEGAFEENAKTDAEDKAEAKKIMKTGKMAPQPKEDAPKIKMRCGKKNGGLVKQGKPKLAKKGWR